MPKVPKSLQATIVKLYKPICSEYADVFIDLKYTVISDYFWYLQFKWGLKISNLIIKMFCHVQYFLKKDL